MGIRKKVCPRCGRKLWLRDFYKLKDGTLRSCCKECERAYKKEEYAAKWKVPDGIFYDARYNRCMEHRGHVKRIHWSDTMIRYLTDHFPTTKNEDLSIHLGVSLRTMIRKARELGLSKDAEFCRECTRAAQIQAKLINCHIRNAGMIKPGEHKSPATEYKKRYSYENK